MLIIKPYGRSHVSSEVKIRRIRVKTNGASDTEEDISKFAYQHPQLVIAQWISVIDKIATKPKKTITRALNSMHFDRNWGTLHGSS